MKLIQKMTLVALLAASSGSSLLASSFGEEPDFFKRLMSSTSSHLAAYNDYPDNQETHKGKFLKFSTITVCQVA